MPTAAVAGRCGFRNVTLLWLLERSAVPLFGDAALRPVVRREAADRRRRVPLSHAVEAAPRRSAGECAGMFLRGFRRDGLRLYAAKVAMCPWPVRVCPSDSDGVLRRVGLVRAGTVRMHTVCGACSSLENAALTR